MTRKGTTTQSGAINRQKILDATIELVCEFGFTATSVNMVCERANIAKTALYWHFKNKEGLMAAVINDVTSKWIEEIEADVSKRGTPLERRQEMLDNFKELVEERPDRLRILLVAVMERKEVAPEIRDAVRRMTDATIDAITAGYREALGIELPDMDLVGHTIIGLVEAALRRKLMDPEGCDMDRLFDDLDHILNLLVRDRITRYQDEAKRA